MNRQSTQMANYLNLDEFYSAGQAIIQAANLPHQPLALISLDFDNFNFINDLFSYSIGDAVLKRITEHFSCHLAPGDIFTRLHADHFTFLVQDTPRGHLTERFCAISNVKEALNGLLPDHYSLVCSGGIVHINDRTDSLPALLDKTNFARKQAKGNHINTFLHYDRKMNEELEWKKVITLAMESALQNHEFEMYLQPKVLIKTTQVVGAEALARWNSPIYGMIYPDRFIPILEQNGFVKQLDFYILEQACLFLADVIASGLPPLPIAVNFSKVHIRTHDFVEKVFQTVNQHGISTNLIEIEFTENIYLDDFQTLIEITSALKYLGFRVALDDFGSAYSSLNYLKDLPLDIIKIDKGFLNASANTDRGRLIIAKVVELIKSLRLVSVMEGVETSEQAEFLQKLCCDFGQGYFYAKPMPQAEYLEFVRRNDPLIDVEQQLRPAQQSSDKSYLQSIPQEFQMDNWELYTLGQNIDMGLMKGYIDDAATVQYVNDRALEYLGYSRREFREIFHNSVTAFTHPDDRAIVQANMEQLIKLGEPLQFHTRAIRKDGKVIILQGRSSCVIDSQGRTVGIHAFQDVTEETARTAELQASLQNKIDELENSIATERAGREALRRSEERYRLLVEQSDDIMFEWDFASDCCQFSEKYFNLFGLPAIQDNISTNKLLRACFLPEDLPLFEKWVTDTYRKSGCNQAEFHIRNAAGDYIWVRCRSTALLDSHNEPIKAVGVFTNLTTA